MIVTIMGWLEIIQYDNKREIKISNLVETTLLTRHPSRKWRAHMIKDNILFLTSLK